VDPEVDRDLRAIGERSGETAEDEDAVWSWAERNAGHNWIYRGLADASFGVRSSLERCAHRSAWPRARSELEIGIYRRFQRHAHLYVESLPGDEDPIEWLALVRHYGAPTRLVDWSYSFHVAVFFAARAADPLASNGNPRSAAVWAIDSNWLEQRGLAYLHEHGAADVAAAYRHDLYCRRAATFGAVYNRRPALPFVLKQNCWRLNERLVAQQGVFLCPGDVERDFEENLAALITPEDCGVRVKKLLFPASLAPALVRRAYRSGVSLATLYPGLEGFVRSLGDLAVSPELLSPAELAAPLGHHQPGTLLRQR
jgi:hypothetical protein